MQQVVVKIKADGTVRCLVNETTQAFVTDSATIRRASHVEPTGAIARTIFHTLRHIFGEYGIMADFTRKWPVAWRVNLAPISGPVLPGTWRDRSAAIAAEIEYLNQNFI